MKENRMIPVAIDDVGRTSLCSVNLYLRLSDSKYVVWLKAGTNPSGEMLDKLRQKGVQDLFVTADDYRSWVHNHLSVASELVDNQAVAPAQKFSVLNQLSDSVMREISALGFSREIFIHAKASSEVVTVMAEAHPEFESFVRQMDAMPGNHVSHAFAVSFVSCMLGAEMGWTNIQTLERLSLAGFLHDVGLMKLPIEITNKPVSRMKHDELVLYQSHCELGRDMLAGLPFMPEDVGTLVYQHHELGSGAGYPQGIRDLQLTPMARVIELTNEFCERAFKNPQQERPASVEEVLMDIEMGMGQPFNKEIFAALKRILDRPQVDKKRA